jgi:hypothetical protein
MMRPAPTGGGLFAASVAAPSVVALFAVAAAGAGTEIGAGSGRPPTGVLVAAEWLGAFVILGCSVTVAALVLLTCPARRRRPEEEPFEQYVERRRLSPLSVAAVTLLARRSSAHEVRDAA